MRMSSQVLKALILAIAATVATSACTSTYWSTLANTSRVTASVTTPGLIAWTVTTNAQGQVASAKAVPTAPVISLLLDANSSPVTFSNAQVSFFDAIAGADAKGKATRNPLTFADGETTVDSLYFPLVAQLSIKDRATAPAPQACTLNGLISQELIDLTDPASSESISIPTILADVSLKGTNSLGQSITANVQVPINVTK